MPFSRAIVRTGSPFRSNVVLLPGRSRSTACTDPVSRLRDILTGIVRLSPATPVPVAVAASLRPGVVVGVHDRAGSSVDEDALDMAVDFRKHAGHPRQTRPAVQRQNDEFLLAVGADNAIPGARQDEGGPRRGDFRRGVNGDGLVDRAEHRDRLAEFIGLTRHIGAEDADALVHLIKRSKVRPRTRRSASSDLRRSREARCSSVTV